jgi:feruloyl-CoA synthase
MLEGNRIQQKLNLGEVSVNTVKKPDGTVIISNNIQLNDINQTMLDSLDQHADQKPEAIFLRERSDQGWNEISYGEFQQRVLNVAGKLLSLELSKDKPLLTLSPNSINHAVILFAAMTISVPVCPVSPAYALMVKNYDRLETVINIIKPSLIYVSDPIMFSDVSHALADKLLVPFFSESATEKILSIHELKAAQAMTVQKTRSEVTPDTIAKILMTSGSTGVPKGVINTHRMMYSNQVALAQLWPFMKDEAPKLVDWLPWSHTFGGNVCFNVALFHGGTLSIDEGKPVPALIGRTIQNLSAGKPNIHFNVPAGIEALLHHLEKDADFASSFFENIKVIFVAAAALPQETRNRMLSVAEQYAKDIPQIFMGWGSTETAPFSTCVYFKTDRAENLGLPMPGTEIKLTREQGNLGLSVKGPNVTPGYWRNEAATEAAFDNDGFYHMGDAGRFIDVKAPERGIAFDGRLSENFKLLSGTWVNVGKLRVDLIDAMRPLITDAVITGHNKADIGLLIVPNYPYLETEYGLQKNEMNAASILQRDDIKSALSYMIAAYNIVNKSSSTHIKRFAVLPLMPDINKNEITDKGYLNQRSLLVNWSALVEEMHSVPTEGLFFFTGHDI